ncbi:MAG: FHA domain-containing protein [Pseudomonadota bacterium]
MKILSRMLSKKIDPQNPDEVDYEFEREELDDAGQVRPATERKKSLSQSIALPEEEQPEVVGSGWAQDGDWDDDWDDDEDWGAEDDPAHVVEGRRKSEEKQHLVSEIREAMTSVNHVQPDEPAEAPMPSAPVGKNWAQDGEMGRQARARSQLELEVDETGDRLLEKTEDVMSDSETSRRRSALAHMKAAAAATKADRVLREVASHDGAADPEEQSPYRDDLAKVVRPHSGARPISRAVSQPDAPTPVWDQGTGDEDAALYAASESGIDEDPVDSIHSEMTAAEELRLSRAPSELSEEDFAADDAEFAASRAARDFPSSRFAQPLDAAEDESGAFDDFEHAADDIAEQSRANDDFDDPFDDDDFEDDFEDSLDDLGEDEGPRPSSAVAEAIAYATAPDEELSEDDEAPQEDVRKKIWEMADEVAAQVETVRASHEPLPGDEEYAEEPSEENMFEVSAAAIAGRAGRSAGRVKTRLLGFQADEEAKDVFAAQDAGTATVVADQFPTGWIVVIDGPGRGASFSLHSGVSQIGRGEDQAVRLDFGDTSISRNNHAAVAFDEEQGKFFLGHGGKSNLVRLNGQPVLSTEEMTDGDEIRIGETSLKFIALCGDDFSWIGYGDNGEDA